MARINNTDVVYWLLKIKEQAMVIGKDCFVA
jgi:hypothetical protein